MNKKGFTLIEMIAVIAILALLIGLVLPNIINANDAKKQAQYDKLVATIENAAKVYHTELNKDARLVLVSNLVKNKYLENTKNPLTGEYFSGCVYINKVDGVYEYTYTDEECVTNYTIVYDANTVNYTGSMSNKTCEMDESCILDPVLYVRQGYTFKGWSKSVSGSVDYSNGENVTDLLPGTTTTLYASWNPVPYTLTVNLDGGVGTNVSGTYYHGNVITLPTPTKSNYTFLGWEITSGTGILSINDITINASDVTITAKWAANHYFAFSYTGTFEVDGTSYTNSSYTIDNDIWSVKFLTSGTLTVNLTTTNIDVFLVGGGGAGGGVGGTWNSMWAGAGGGAGGYTTTVYNKEVTEGTYEIVVGAGGVGTTGGSGSAGGASTAFDLTANGGGGASVSSYSSTGADGGSGGGGSGQPYAAWNGGVGGSDGSDGTKGNAAGGAGQGTTTRAFGESDGDLYAGGGGGGGAAGGSGGGGAGSPSSSNLNGSNGTDNLGGGGGGATGISGSSGKGGNGGTGIVIIRGSSTPLIVNLNGGTTTQTFKQSYRRGLEITLETPTKEGATFKGWTVFGTNAQLSGNVLTMGTNDTTITANWDVTFALTYDGTFKVGGSTYTNTSYTFTTEDWEVEFLTSGKVSIISNGNFDIFLVGGGGAGGGVNGTWNNMWAGAGGGGGGYTLTSLNKELIQGTYDIVIGSGGIGSSGNGGKGGTTSAFGLSVLGGEGALVSSYSSTGAAGGSGGGGSGQPYVAWNGGVGGSDGSSGTAGNADGGTGQGTTTRAFSESTGTLYAGGGGGGGAAGGAGGGGAGSSSSSSVNGSNGTDNTGGGGGGAVGITDTAAKGGNGGSGIVILRNKR